MRDSLIVFAGDSTAFVFIHWFGLLVVFALVIAGRALWRWFFR